MKKALILQGWKQKTSENWYPWLEKMLQKKGYNTYLPDLPTMHTDLPDMNAQLAYLGKLLTFEDETIVIGHSLGAVLGLRLGERESFQKLLIISGWDFDELTVEHQLFWPNKINHAKIKENVKEIYCITSDNDPYFTSFHTEEMSKRFNGKFILIKDAGHFTQRDGITEIPELLKFI